MVVDRAVGGRKSSVEIVRLSQWCVTCSKSGAVLSQDGLCEILWSSDG